MSGLVSTEQLLDLAAFIKKAAENKTYPKMDILFHAKHDIEGFIHKNLDDGFWVPRTKNWRKR